MNWQRSIGPLPRSRVAEAAPHGDEHGAGAHLERMAAANHRYGALVRRLEFRGLLLP